MATVSQWIGGARPRTLPAAIAPVAAGLGWDVVGGRGLLALVVALALQVGVNYSNDYSDGVRGTDDSRLGPIRLVGQRLTTPAAVKRAAWRSFAVAALAGLALVLITGEWWIVAVGVAAIISAWFYTGGPRPYGYAGLGEVFVFVFFGVVAVCGTEYVVLGTVTWDAGVASVGIGALACAILVVNNLRDIPTDAVAGKQTLAVRLGDRRTRVLFTLLIAGAAAIALAIGVVGVVVRPESWAGGAAVGVVAIAAAIEPLRVVAADAVGRSLVPALSGTGRTLLLYGVLMGLGAAVL